jgi:hypothetical protein
MRSFSREVRLFEKKKSAGKEAWRASALKFDRKSASKTERQRSTSRKFIGKICQSSKTMMRQVLIVFFALLVVRALAEGELRVRDNEGFLVAVEHFPVHGLLTIDRLVPPLQSAAEVKITLVVSGGASMQKIRTQAKKDGTFTLLDVPPGEHSLQIVAVGFSFPPVVVSVDGENNGEVQMRYAEDASTILPKMREEKTGYERVQIQPVSELDYFEPSNRLTLIGLLKNPMVLMVLMTVIMAVMVPKMIANMDPEALEELKKEMGKGNMFQQMAAANKAIDNSIEKQVTSVVADKKTDKKK